MSVIYQAGLDVRGKAKGGHIGTALICIISGAHGAVLPYLMCILYHFRPSIMCLACAGFIGSLVEITGYLRHVQVQ